MGSFSHASSPGGWSAVEERVRQFLIKRAQDASPDRPFTALVTYGELCAAVDPEEAYFAWPRFRGIGQVLARISTDEHQHGRPMLSALVVRKQTRQAGDGFAVLGRSLGERIQDGEERSFWRSQVEAVVTYWSGQGGSEDVQAASDPAATRARALSLLARAVADIEEASKLLSAG
jgi:hypothetical protein